MADLRGMWRQARREFRVASGPRVARTFHALFALVSLCAWLSLACQVEVLFGERGLLPVANLLATVEARDPSFWHFPTWLAWTSGSDAWLIAGAWAGVVLSLIALLGIVPRLCFALSTFLYLGYVAVGQDFLAFQWDSMLIEIGVLAVLLPRNKEAPWFHLLLRFALFKLYLESGIAKWQSPLHDWHDGSAMTYYYETAPLPTWLGWYFHQLPSWWHHIESWAVLALELGGSFLILLPRLGRLAALFGFTLFQLVNLATANYGFFVYLSLAMHVMLLDERDLERLAGWLRRVLPDALFRPLDALARLGAALELPRIDWSRARWLPRAAVASVVSLWLALSLLSGASHFARYRGLPSVQRTVASLHVVNAYYLFTQITRTRIEPTFELSDDGVTWTPSQMHHKADDPQRAPDFVAPHQPRVDFRLWFYGLGFGRGRPLYVSRLLDRLCRDPEAVQPLFQTELPSAPAMVRISFYRHTFTTRQEREATGAWWKRAIVASQPPVRCSRGD